MMVYSVQDNNVVWSRGNGDVYWELIKKFTSDGPVQQALWFHFDENPNRPACSNIQSPVGKGPSKKIPSLCIVEKSKITVLTKEGDEFISAVPYEIQKVWKTKYGLIIEKFPNSNPEIPNWFSLYHPLEEIVPIVLRDGIDRDHVNFARDKKLKIVFTCDNPSICVTYNEDTGLHSIWLIRKAEVDETLFLGSKNNPSSQNSYSGTFVPSVTSLSLSKSFALSQLQNTSLQSPNLTHLFNSSTKQTPKFDAESSRFTTPKASKSFIQHFGLSSLQLTQSKLSGTPPIRRLGSSRISAILARTPMPSPSASSCLNDLDAPEDEEPLFPDLCLQILWTEDQKKTSQSAAVKAFVASDWLGKSYICWLLEDEKLLRCVEVKVTVSYSCDPLTPFQFKPFKFSFEGEQNYRPSAVHLLFTVDHCGKRCRVHSGHKGRLDLGRNIRQQLDSLLGMHEISKSARPHLPSPHRNFHVDAAS